MHQLRSVSVFFLIAVVVYAAIVLFPWTGPREAYRSIFTGSIYGVYGRFGSEGLVRCENFDIDAMEDVNIINADVLMKECGIEVVVASNNEKGAFSSSLAAELETDTGTYACGGTLFGNDMPRLIRLGDYRLDAFLDGFLMIFTHDDVPGIIGHVGTILGSHKVNIAQMAVGRASEQPGAEAVGVLNLDGKPLAESVAEVLNHAQIRSVRIIQLPAAGQLPNWLQA